MTPGEIVLPDGRVGKPLVNTTIRYRCENTVGERFKKDGSFSSYVRCGYIEPFYEVVEFEGEQYAVRQGEGFQYSRSLDALPNPCPRCGLPGGWKHTELRVRLTVSACDSDCAHATGSECRCSCGGANHGIAS